MKRKFKVGDKIQIVTTDAEYVSYAHDIVNVGMVGTVEIVEPESYTCDLVYFVSIPELKGKLSYYDGKRTKEKDGFWCSESMLDFEKPTRKFKIGDKVRILDGSNIPDYRGGFTYSMRDYIGKTATIEKYDDWRDKKGYRLEEFDYAWDERGLELVEEKPEETIVIYRDGNKVIALDKRTNTKHVAVCSPEDEFNFLTGANLAFNRLYEQECKPKYYNGKVVCIEPYPGITTKGKIYEFVDGLITFDDGDKSDERWKCKTFEDVNRSFASKFIEVVE